MEKTALSKISYGLYVVGVRNGEGFGGCIVDAFIQATLMPPTAILCSMRHTLTNALIKEHGILTLSILPADVDPMIISNFGLQSARDADKWSRVETNWRDELPSLRCACAGMLLKVVDARDLTTHTMFFCDILDAWEGDGSPLLYADYQRDMKPAAMVALQALKEK